MLESIKISKIATFQGSDQTLDNLAKFNFVFGPNGSGKTTISRLIADITSYPSSTLTWKAGAALQTLVYNRDFVERNFTQSPELKGVFTLGEGVGIKEKIDIARTELDDYAKKIASRKLQLLSQDGKSGKTIELATLEEELKNTCWNQKKKHDPKLQGAFDGYRNSLEKFKGKILQELVSNTSDLIKQEELEKRAETVFGKTLTTEIPVPSVDINVLQLYEQNPILRKRVIGKSDVDIAAMITKLGNSDWIRQGRSFYEANDSVCPFCQQSTEEAFGKSLNEYFDEAFEADTKAIDDLQTNFKADADRLQKQLASIITTPSKFLDVEKLKSEKELFDSRITINLQRLAEKKKEPSRIVELESISNIGAAIKELIDTANASVTEHNRLVNNIAMERRTLTSQVWKFLVVELKEELYKYSQKFGELNRTIESINNAIKQFESDKLIKEKEIQNLEKQTTSVKPTLDGINKLLISFGFNSFSLAPADDGVSYRLVRSDGADAKESLSEGEKSFVTFLYFYYLLKGSNSRIGITTDRVIVFDDPVSSLDSDVLFIVSTLIKRIRDEISSTTGNIKQMFVFTHNVYFHKEVTFNAKRSGKDAFKDETFWIVRKAGAISTVERFKTNPVSTSYELLWSDVKNADRSHSTISNTLRRILEHYFKILGGVDADNICEKFHGNDKLVCKSLFSWVNAGSHGISDDLYISDNGTSVETYLRIFREVFEKLEHSAHYKMMMGEDFSDNAANQSEEVPIKKRAA